MKLEVIGEKEFDRADPNNRGVLADELVSTGEGVALRRVTFQDHKTGTVYTFLTNLSVKVPPGIVARLYKMLRWLKNHLDSARSWARALARLAKIYSRS